MRMIVDAKIVKDVLVVEVCHNQEKGRCNHDRVDWSQGKAGTPEYKEHMVTIPHDFITFDKDTPHKDVLSSVFPEPVRGVRVNELIGKMG